MATRYNVYFAGEVLPGWQTGAVRDNLARLFKADAATLDRLFSGQRQLIKRDCESDRANQYLQAMEQAGARALLLEVAPPAEPPAAQAGGQTMADRIAALANAEDDNRYRSDAKAKPVAPLRPASEVGLKVAPVGSDLLQPEERPAPVTRAPQSTSLGLDDRLSAEPPPPPPPPPTEHIVLDESGGNVATLPGAEPIPEPDLSGLDLSPPGTDFSDCAPPAPQLPPLDLSHLGVAPAGSDLLDAQHRRGEAPPPPATDHLTLDS